MSSAKKTVTTLTREQWSEVEAQLRYTGAMAHLLVDGYLITIERSRATEMRDVFICYVDGVFRGKWTTEDCEIRRRFIRASQRKVFKGRYRQHLQSVVSKRNTPREIKKWARESLDKSVTIYLWHWNSFGALRRHLQQNNERIEHLSREDACARLEALKNDAGSDDNGR